MARWPDTTLKSRDSVPSVIDRLAWLDDARQDVRYAARTLLNNPGFAAAAITTLALGIGASTAIFSVAYGVSFRPLRYPEPDRLIRIYEAHPATGELKQDVAEATFHDWREGAPSLESAALYTKATTRVLAGERQHQVATMHVSPAFFDVLGVRPLLGPGFKPEHEYSRGDSETVLSYEAWQRLFGGRRDIIGTTYELAARAGNDDAYRIVGVMPEGFAFSEAVDLWQETIIRPPFRPTVRNWRYDRVIARIRRGATADQARAELETVTRRLSHDLPVTNAGWTVTIESLHDSIVGNFGRATWLLLAAVAVTLLVTCVNVAALLVARAVARQRETAVRAALGAGLSRLVRQWLAEALLLAGLGAAFGLLLAWIGVSALKAAAPPGVPRLDAIAIDWTALVLTAAVSLAALVSLALAPLTGHASRGEFVDALRAGSPEAGDNRRRQIGRTVLIATQCAGATALVILAVMLTRSFVKLTSLDLGWNPAGVLGLSVSPQMPRELRRPWFRYVEWSDRLIARLEAAPGIERAAITTQIPLSTLNSASTLARGRGKNADDNERWPAVVHVVSDGSFDVMGIRLVAGRMFEAADRWSEAQLTGEQQGDGLVVVVSETVARTLWPGRPALGEALWEPIADTIAWREVVGVVEDIHFYGVGESPGLHIFVPWTQSRHGRPLLVVKSSTSAGAIAASVRGIIEEVEPGTIVDQVVSFDALVSRATAQPRFTTCVVSAFGALALLLAAVGIHGTLAYFIGVRRREIGIQLALGASPRDIIFRTLWRGVLPAVVGGLAGVAGAIGLARTFRVLLFNVEPLDIGSFAGGAVLLLLVALAAAFGPALRAARLDPAVALRHE